MPFNFRNLDVPDVLLIEPVSFGDDRGFFMELYKRSDFSSHCIDQEFAQDNLSRSRKGVLRGLHYQDPPKTQAKLVKAIRGEIIDIAVDLRRGSPTFGRHVLATLSDENSRMLFVPEGFAHGFLVLSEVADVLYKVTAEYAPELDRGITWDDPELGLDLPLGDPILSDKDRALPKLADVDVPFAYELKRAGR